jgi:hypothetical protein
MTAPPTGSRWRHVVRGTTYEVQGVATLQVGGPLDGAQVVVYRCETTWALYVRPVDEFMDGRLELEPLKPLRFNMESPPTAAEVDRLRALGIDVRGWYRARLA